MLSQRMAKLHMLRSWGIAGPALEDASSRAKVDFGSGLDELLASPRNTASILDELAAGHLQWTWFEFAIDLGGAISYQLVVDDSSESILNSMDAITGMYEVLTVP